MKNQIETSFHETVEKISERLNTSTTKAWHIMYDSGIEFIDTLQIRIQRKREFDSQFGVMLEKPHFSELTIDAVFSEIKTSPIFWQWWASKMYFNCENACDQPTLIYALDLTTSIIPVFILNKIFFYGKHKESGSSAAIVSLPGTPATTPSASQTRVGKQVGSRV